MSADVMERWLTKEYDYDRPRRGQIREGEIIKIEPEGVTIDLGLKRDGFVPYKDVERLEEEAASALELGQEIKARIVRLEDAEGSLMLSLYQARFERDWKQAGKLLESGEIWQGQVIDCNRGGLIVRFGHLQAFVPASHLWKRPERHLSSDQRKAKLQDYVEQELAFKVIEVNQERRRLILSERLARRQIQEQNIERLLGELVEGQVVRGTVSRLLDFGAFVDLGGADGLIHISELAWRRVRHPSKVLQVGDEIDVYVLSLDYERKRIGLSLKRLQPNPWTLVDETYTVDQLVSGTVTNVVEFGAFVALDTGVEGLVHVAELADSPPSNPRELVKPGDQLVLRILRIDSFRERIALSLKQVSEQTRDEWLAQQAEGGMAGTDQANSPASGRDEAPTPLASEATETSPAEPEQLEDVSLREKSTPASAGQPEDESFWISLVEDEGLEKAL
jgi:small subunit ribosomal protein S1